MGKEDIIDYVMKTPENTNPNILRSLLDSEANNNKFIVTLTPTAEDFSGTMDKTVAEINAAYEAGQEIWFKIAVGSDWTEYPLSRVGKLNAFEYPSFNCNALYDESNVLVMIYTGTTDDGTRQTYSTKVYSLTPQAN